MTKREAAIVSAYTGFLLGDFSDLHAYIEEICKRPVFTHELINVETMNVIKDLAKSDFISITVK